MVLFLQAPFFSHHDIKGSMFLLICSCKRVNELFCVKCNHCQVSRGKMWIIDEMIAIKLGKMWIMDEMLAIRLSCYFL